MRVFKEKENIIDYCAENNEGCFNLLKVLEEMAEFQEVITKNETKHPTNQSKPKKEEMIKEFGDLLYRGMIYLRQQFPDMSVPELVSAIEGRIAKKLSNLEEWKKQDLYKSGL